MKQLLSRAGPVQRALPRRRANLRPSRSLFQINARMQHKHAILSDNFKERQPWSYFRKQWESYDRDTTTSEQLSHVLQLYQLPKWGFVVYRCTYGDEQAWSRFMGRLNGLVGQAFPDNGDLDTQLRLRHDWTVQEDISLDNASKDEVRRRFVRWTETQGKEEYKPVSELDQAIVLGDVPRYSYCIAVDKPSLESVLLYEGQELPEESFVNVIRADEAWIDRQYPDFSTFDWTTYVEPENEEDYLDQGETEVEGCRLHDTGWMRYSLVRLMPGLWRHLAGAHHKWDRLYCRPFSGYGPRNKLLD